MRKTEDVKEPVRRNCCYFQEDSSKCLLPWERERESGTYCYIEQIGLFLLTFIKSVCYYMYFRYVITQARIEQYILFYCVIRREIIPRFIVKYWILSHPNDFRFRQSDLWLMIIWQNSPFRVNNKTTFLKAEFLNILFSSVTRQSSQTSLMMIVIAKMDLIRTLYNFFITFQNNSRKTGSLISLHGELGKPLNSKLP